MYSCTSFKTVVLHFLCFKCCIHSSKCYDPILAFDGSWLRFHHECEIEQASNSEDPDGSRQNSNKHNEKPPKIDKEIVSASWCISHNMTSCVIKRSQISTISCLCSARVTRTRQRETSYLLQLALIFEDFRDPILFFMTDEVWFHLSGYVNTQNCRHWSQCNESIETYRFYVGYPVKVSGTKFRCSVPIKLLSDESIHTPIYKRVNVLEVHPPTLSPRQHAVPMATTLDSFPVAMVMGDGGGGSGSSFTTQTEFPFTALE
ncbi:hypothetical protein C0J52_12387 [Blattella germanica]|nr:hypothetical protein C0J52_12387 [Blattella germanica]